MTSKKTIVKPWAGRLKETTDEFVEQFTESVSYDHRLYRHDIQGSIAHVRMLAKVGTLTKKEVNTLTGSLEDILQEIDKGSFNWNVQLEDVHMNIELALIDKLGDLGKKLHTGRSRNDQVATDLRLYLREEVDALRSRLQLLMHALLDLAEREADTIMPGFTHMQIAQPVTFGHHMLAWFEMLKRDDQRFADCRKRINIMPLGSAALAGTSYPIDRDYAAGLMDFDSVTKNSLDAVSDRDFIIEFCAAASMTMMHLSRFSEELVLWVSPMFGFIGLGDSYCTGSSIMSQKKNPDVPELVRGKTGQVYGDLMAMLTLMKSQPLAYNRDNQEDKLSLFNTIDTLHACLTVYSGMASVISVNRDVMLEAASKGFSTATDLADYLVQNGMPFRDAHNAVGKTVGYALDKGKALADLSLAELGNFCGEVKDDVYGFLELKGSVDARNHIGGTAPQQVRQAVVDAIAYLASES